MREKAEGFVVARCKKSFFPVMRELGQKLDCIAHKEEILKKKIEHQPRHYSNNSTPKII